MIRLVGLSIASGWMESRYFLLHKFDTQGKVRLRSISTEAVLLVMVVLSTTANAFSIYGNDLLRKFRMLILEVFYNTLAKLSGVHQ